MPWDDATMLESKLNRALSEFNWPRAEELCNDIIERVKTDADAIPEGSAKRFMYSLRRKRRFGLMTRLAEAMLQSGLQTQQVRRQYAQALIDQGVLAAGEMVLHSILQEPQGIKAEVLEARGLMGRIYKQLYVNLKDPKSPRNRANLERAINEYLFVYRLDPQTWLWHGINVVALVARAKRDELALTGLPDATTLAQEILATIDAKEREAVEPLPPWDIGTRLEAFVALGQHRQAADTALTYIDNPSADAFEIASTLRQFVEVWQLNDTEPPGNLVMPILRAGHLSKEGASVIRNTTKVTHEANVVREAIGDANTGLECIFGAERMSTLKWYQKGLHQCSSVARVEQRTGIGHGTGWLVNAKDFFPDEQGVLLLTNNHVVSASSNPYALYPEDCQINFQAEGQLLGAEKEVVWSSEYTKLDATFLRLNGKPKAAPLELYARPIQMSEPPPRLYIIGHPQGRDLEISLQDNYLLATNESLLHYRTPTEPGSSGSPVFEPLDWRVVALHHKGHEKMARIDGKDGTYEANEGISILALQAETRKRTSKKASSTKRKSKGRRE